MTFKPLLAATLKTGETATLKYPVLASVKLDGVRAIVRDGVVYSRNLKPIPNKHVQQLFGRPELNGLDGELIVGPPNSPTVYASTVSGVMTQDGEPDVRYYIFDDASEERANQPYIQRYERIAAIEENTHRVVTVKQVMIRTEEQLLEYEDVLLTDGYEGVMVRSPDGKYKHGRSTSREGIIFKLKRFVDGEAIVLGFEEQFKNNNVAVGTTRICESF